MSQGEPLKLKSSPFSGYSYRNALTGGLWIIKRQSNPHSLEATLPLCLSFWTSVEPWATLPQKGKAFPTAPSGIALFLALALYPLKPLINSPHPAGTIA
jgi:hypothetical protein